MKAYKKFLRFIAGNFQQNQIPESLMKTVMVMLKAVSYLAGATPINRSKK